MGDTTVESDESFQMLLSAAANALLNPYASSGTVQISNDDLIPVSTYIKGQAVIDLGKNYGKLIKPVTVDGGRVYYYWDVSGDGTSGDTQGSGYANSSDSVTHDWLDQIFQQDVNGRVEGENGTPVVYQDGDTDNTYRFATINGVKLALPTVGNGDDFIDSGEKGARNGTAVEGMIDNPTYDDWLAIWDGYNGAQAIWNRYDGTWVWKSDMDRGPYIDGAPLGWADKYYGFTYYWSATPATSGHAGIILDAGDVGYSIDYSSMYVAVQVL